ncbi:MAG: fibronectin type III domain-containing protein [Flavobacteriales bacterium]|nr:fibronectin type III domain-containing protein [Flavobacteriales bacterium]
MSGLLLASCFGLAGFAQRNCGSMHYLEQQIAADPERAGRLEMIDAQTNNWIAEHGAEDRAVVTIPVVFHVVYANSTQNISDARINAQLAQLNADFARLNSDAGSTPSAFAGLAANTEIQFCLAQRDPSGNATSGIVRRSTTVTSFTDNDNVKRTANGGSDAWSRDSYLNIWVCNLGSSLLGYAQFPGGAASTDGVVVLYSSVGGIGTPGTASPYNLGRTATHEVGHWLNLRHIWGDASCGSDLVSDTPTQQQDNAGCPSFPHVTCSNGPNGDMFMNYMDYTDDACMNMFSAGQKSRMQALFGTGGSRVALLSSLGCTPPSGTTCGVPGGLASSSVTTSSASVSWSAATGAVSYNLQYKLSSVSTWTTVNTTATSYALNGLSASTSYNFQVSTVCSSSSSAYSTAASFTTLATGCADALEPNNSTSAAATVTLPLSMNALVSSATDADYYSFTLASTSNISVGLSNLAADYDLRLLNSSGTQLASSANGSTTAETISYSNAAAGTYYIHAFGYNGAFSATQCYALTASATTVASCGTPSGLTASSINTSGATLGWTAVSGATSYNVQYKLASASTWTTVTSTTNTRALTGLSAGTAYNAQVQAVCSSGSSSYGTAINFTTTAVSGCTDTWESNGTSATAKTIATNTDIQGTIGSNGDSDWYKFTNTSSASRIRINLTNLAGDYDVRLYRGTSTQVGISQNSGTTAEQIILNTTTVATYYVRVYGYNGAFSASQCYTLRANTSGSNFREGVFADDEEIELEPVSGLLNLYPNPTANDLKLDYAAKAEGTLRITVIDGMGREVLNTNQAVATGASTLSLALPELSNGMYVLRIVEGGEQHQLRFQVQH